LGPLPTWKINVNKKTTDCPSNLFKIIDHRKPVL